MITPKYALILSCAAILALSGCGGGGSTPATKPMDASQPTLKPMDTSQRFGFLPGNAQGAIVKAAGSTPNAGSVMQSSNTDSGITADSVSVAVTRGSDGTVTFRVNEAGGWTVDRSSARVLNGGTDQEEGWSWAEFHQAPDGSSGTGTGPGLYVDVYTDIEPPTETPARCGVGSTVSAGSPCIWEANGQRFTLSIESGLVCFRGGALNSCAGRNQNLRGVTINGLPLTIVTEGSGTSRRITALSDNLMLVGDSGAASVQDADYLAGGIWVRVPADATSVADYEFGAFVDGNDPFEQSNLAGLTGEATYSGDATAVYSVVSTGRNYFPDAKASLTARFGDGDALGTIEGRIHDITGEGPASDSYDGVVVNLGSAAIGASDSGFFTGDTSTTGTDSEFTGKWGGQFYGNGAAPTDPPGSVAGTFGAATADGGESFVGVFGADRQQ